MSLLELYGSKGQPVASHGKSTLSLVQQLSTSAESANKHHSSYQSDDIDTDTNASSSASQIDYNIIIPKQNSTIDLPSHQSNAKPHPCTLHTSFSKSHLKERRA